MIYICITDPKLWELWYTPYFWVMQDVYHESYYSTVRRLYLLRASSRPSHDRAMVVCPKKNTPPHVTVAKP